MSFSRLTRAGVFFRVATTNNLHRRWVPRAMYSTEGRLSREVITSRVLETLKGNERIDASKLGVSSSFKQDLGLDSLDSVEVLMAVEEEFSIEIPDAEADDIQTVEQVINYIEKTPEAH